MADSVEYQVAVFQAMYGQITWLNAQGVVPSVKIYAGEPALCKEWIQAVEVYAVLADLGPDKILRVALTVE